MTDPSIEKYLGEQKFFAGLSPEFIGFLAQCTGERKIDRNELLFRQGERARHFYLLRKGGIFIEIPAITGPTLTVQILKSGQVLGWSWLIPPYKWNFQARADTPSSVLEFDGDRILARCEEDPKFGYEILKRFSSLMAERLEAAHRKMIDQWVPAGFA